MFLQNEIVSLKSKGVKQRVHPTKVVGDEVFISVNRSSKAPDGSDIESDRYADLASMMDIPAGSLTIAKVEAGGGGFGGGAGGSYPIHSSYGSRR